MQVMFNSQERTLREIVALAASSGWKVVRVTKTAASLFGHIVAVPGAIPIQKRARAGSGSAFLDSAIAGAKTRIPQNLDEPIIKATADEEKRYRDDMQTIERASSRCGTPTFGSRTELSSVEEALAKFGGGVIRPKNLRGPSVSTFAKRSALKPAVSLSLKKKPSPLSVPLPRCSPPLPSPTGMVGSPRHDQTQSPASPALVQRRLSLAHLRSQSQHGPQAMSQPPLSATRQLPPLSPISPRHSTHVSLSRRPSHTQLSQAGQSQFQSQAPLILPSLIPVRSAEPVTPISHQEHRQRHATPIMISSRKDSPRPILTRRSSYAQLPQVPLRKRSGTVIEPLQTTNLNAGFGAEIPGNSGLILGVFSSSRGGTGGTLGGAVLRFEAEIDDQKKDGGSTRPQSPVVGVSVLAAAARIERGDFLKSSSP